MGNRGYPLLGSVASSFNRGVSNAASVATLRAAQISIAVSRNVYSLTLSGALLWGTYGAPIYTAALMRGALIATEIPTWLPRIYIAADLFDIAMAAWGTMTNLLENTDQEFDGLGNGIRGRLVEDVADANVAGNVAGVDDVRVVPDGKIFVTSIKSHDAADPQSLLRDIKGDLRDLYNKSSWVMSGTDRNGNFRRFRPEDVGGKGLIVAVPYN